MLENEIDQIKLFMNEIKAQNLYPENGQITEVISVLENTQLQDE